jgi:hypothetical protein
MYEPNEDFWADAWDDTPMLAFEMRQRMRETRPPDVKMNWVPFELSPAAQQRRAQREQNAMPLVRLEVLALDAELQEFFLSSECVGMEVEAERSRA